MTEKVTLGEWILPGTISFIFVVFLITARQYTPESRMFPDLVSVAGLFFVLWRFLAAVRNLSVGDLGWIYRTTFFGGQMSWQWSVAMMAGFILSTYVLGFVAGSMVYVISTITLSGDRKWARTAVIGISTAVSMYILAKIVHLQLPLGFLEFIR